jgi:hypothetical protein
LKRALSMGLALLAGAGCTGGRDQQYLTKLLTPPQVDHVAVREELCDVRRPHPLAKGASTQREVDLTGGGCVVR